MIEHNFESGKHYDDPFNDIEVDVVLTGPGGSWRVPAFWRGGSQWTVRFSPPVPGTYPYHLECSDRHNPDLNGGSGQFLVTPYSGTNALLQHGSLKVSGDRRHFEHADGTPFYWLADTWWTGLSERLSWEDFQELTADRKAKGFTVVQLVAGLVPTPEETAPIDPGCRNEGGAAWDESFKQINPAYFDYADRRVQHLLDAGIVPAIVGGWRGILAQMGVGQMKKHWRYIIARYGAYPVFWIAGGEVFDPPPEIERKVQGTALFPGLRAPGWTEVVRYIRAVDPYHHPLTVHEVDPPYDAPVQDDRLVDFKLFQAGHRSWPSIATEVALLNKHYSRTDVTRPLVVGEIGYEGLGAIHLEDFQRVAFWLGALNGAAGHSYGAIGTWMSYSADKPLHRIRFSFTSWREGMSLPGSRQVGLGAQLLREYQWWNFKPHPEWVTPRGTTLLKPHGGGHEIDIDLVAALSLPHPPRDEELPLGEWQRQKGEFRLPYAAGIPGKTRFIYIPYFGFRIREAPTVLGLEQGVRYHAYYWDPSLGIKFDLGTLERPPVGALLFSGPFDELKSSWHRWGEATVSRGKLSTRGRLIAARASVTATDLTAAVEARSRSNAGLLLRFQDPDNYLAALYSARHKTLCLMERKGGADPTYLGTTEIGSLQSNIRLEAEVRANAAMACLADGRSQYTTPIVGVSGGSTGTAGVLHEDDGELQEFHQFEVRRSSVVESGEPRQRRLYDGNGIYRGELRSPDTWNANAFGLSSWSDLGQQKLLLRDAYQPERLPYFRDWLLVLESVP